MKIFPYKLLLTFRIRFPRLSGLFLSAVHSQLPSVILNPKPGIISQKHKFIYIPIPKVACSSIKKSLLPIFDLDYNLNPHQAPFPTIPNREIIAQKEYLTFAFVRNPWDRLVSCYRSKIRSASVNYPSMVNGVFVGFLKKYGNRFYADMTFTDFTTEVCRIPDSISDPHFRSQYYSLAPNGELLPNFLGRFENLENDFQEICRIAGLPLKLPHMFGNKAKEDHKKPWVKVDYRGYYTKELEEMVRKRYSRDIDLFEYTFDK